MRVRFFVGCGFQLETDIVKVKLDTSYWPLPSAGGAFQRRLKPNPPPAAATLPCHSRTTEVGAVRLWVCV